SKFDDFHPERSQLSYFIGAVRKCSRGRPAEAPNLPTDSPDEPLLLKRWNETVAETVAPSKISKKWLGRGS
ncbi:MAG: hypothetical protein ACR2NN_21930, partial [Bryobacteraceae bacterium]